MQDPKIQRLRYRLRSISCENIHIRIVSGTHVVVRFVFRGNSYRRFLSIENLDFFPQFQPEFSEV